MSQILPTLQSESGEEAKLGRRHEHAVDGPKQGQPRFSQNWTAIIYANDCKYSNIQAQRTSIQAQRTVPMSQARRR